MLKLLHKNHLDFLDNNATESTNNGAMEDLGHSARIFIIVSYETSMVN